MNVEPYLFFDGRCEEAMNFYKTALGAEIVCVNRFKDAPDSGSCPDKHIFFQRGHVAFLADVFQFGEAVIRQMHIFAGITQGEIQRQSGEHIKAAACPGNEDVFAMLKLVSDG